MEKKKEDSSLISDDKSSTQLTLEQVLNDYVGSFGAFQKWLTVYICLFIGPITSMNMISQFLLFLIPPHSCNITNFDGPISLKTPTPLPFNNVTTETYTSLTELSFNIELDGSCAIRRSISNITELSDSVLCPNGWQYNHDIIYPTPVSENDWVCDQRWKSLLPHSVFWAGATIGCFVFGVFSDIFGRVSTTMVLFTIAGLSGIAGVILSDNYALFVITRGLMGFSFTGSVTLVLVIEFVGLQQRLLVSTIFVASHSITSALWSLFAYYISSWRLLLILASLAQFLVPIISLFTPESARWLYSKGRTKQGAKVLRTVAQFNGKELPDSVVESITFRKPVSFQISELLQYRKLCRNFIFAGFLSILNGIVFIGTNLYAAVLLKNPFLVLALNAFIDGVACLISKSLADRYGRCYTMLINLISAFICYEATYFMETDSIQFMVLFYLGRFTSANTFNILYLYVAEIVPTYLRSRAVSTRLCLNNFGAFIAPFVIGLYAYNSFLPLAVFGLTAAIAAVLVMFLPETLGIPLPETCAEADKL